MKLYVNKKIIFGFLASVLTILALGVGAFFYITNVIELSHEGANTNKILLLSEQIKSQVNTLENIFQNGMTDENTRQRYLHARTLTLGKLGELEILTRINQEQNATVSQITREFNRITDVLNTSNPIEISANPISGLIDALQSRETELKKERQGFVTNQFYQFALTFFGLLALGLILPFALVFSLNANLKVRAKHEEQLTQAATSIHELYENAPCGYFSINHDGIFTHANAALLQCLGYSRDEVIDRLHIKALLPMNETGFFEKNFSGLAGNETANDLETRILRKSGSIVPVSINATAVPDNNGKIAIRCTLFDITALKKAEEETLRANKELESFSYSVSHDLRAPLRSINGFAKILEEDYKEKLDEDGVRILTRIITNANRMGHLIDDLLDFARVGKKEMDKSQIDLDEFVKVTTGELMDQEPGRAVSVDIQPLGTCLADQSMIRQVWINLISNALKYTRKKDSARIEIGHLNGSQNLSEKVFFVRDNGVGFDMQFTNKLFGVFQRLHKAEDFEGTGVGLALVKRIIERHNGRIWAEAKVNEGATFYFTIP